MIAFHLLVIILSYSQFHLYLHRILATPKCHSTNTKINKWAKISPVGFSRLPFIIELSISSNIYLQFLQISAEIFAWENVSLIKVWSENRN